MNLNSRLKTIRGVILATTVGLTTLSAGSAMCQRSARSSQVNGGQSSRSASSTQNGGCAPSTGSTTGSTSTASSSSTGSTSATTLISATRASSTSATLTYSGSTSNVEKVYLATLDANGKVIAQSEITSFPVQATLAINSSARYYAAMVVYSNGTSKTTYSKVK